MKPDPLDYERKPAAAPPDANMLADAGMQVFAWMAVMLVYAAAAKLF